MAIIKIPLVQVIEIEIVIVIVIVKVITIVVVVVVVIVVVVVVAVVVVVVVIISMMHVDVYEIDDTGLFLEDSGLDKGLPSVSELSHGSMHVVPQPFGQGSCSGRGSKKRCKSVICGAWSVWKKVSGIQRV